MLRALLLLAFFALPGCLPSAVTLHFGDTTGKLKEAVVYQDSASGASAKVALLDIRGLIIDAAQPGLFMAGRNPVAELADRLKLAAEDSSVRAIVLRINSPGGGVAASETMYIQLRRFRETTGKPVVVSMGDVAASGGYYIALAADHIVAQPTTITASIGVIIPTVNFSEGMKKIGIVSRSIKSGANKDLANPLEPMRDEQYAVLQGLVNEFYARFKSVVIARRPNLAKDKVDQVTDGRVVTGATAVEVGLADSEGDVLAAFDHAKRLAKIPSAQLIKYHRGDQRPATPYAGAESEIMAGAMPPLGGQGGGSDVNLLQVRLGLGELNDAWASTGGVYYLWLPAGH